MENKVLDISVSARLINTKSLKWDIAAAASHYKNKVTYLKTGNFNTAIGSGQVRTQVGSPLGLFYGYKTNGIFTTSAEASSASLSKMIGTQKVAYTAGDVRFIDLDNNGIINENDMQVIGDPNPDVFGTVSTNINWRRFNLSAVLNIQ